MSQVQAGPANRRVFQRRLSRNTVKVQCRKGSFGLGPNVAVTLLDVSLDGIRLTLKTPVDVNQEVEVVFEGYGFKSFKRIAKVRWVLPLENGQVVVGLQLESRLGYADVQRLAKL